MDGVITFYSTHHALRAEAVLRRAGVPVRVVPGPRELSPSCGVALRFPYEQAAQVASLLDQAGVEVERLVQYPERRRAGTGGWRAWVGRGAR